MCVSGVVVGVIDVVVGVIVENLSGNVAMVATSPETVRGQVS